MKSFILPEMEVVMFKDSIIVTSGDPICSWVCVKECPNKCPNNECGFADCAPLTR